MRSRLFGNGAQCFVVRISWPHPFDNICGQNKPSQLNPFSNQPLVLTIPAINQPGPVHVLERAPFHLPYFPNHHEQPDLARHGRIHTYTIFFEPLCQYIFDFQVFEKLAVLLDPRVFRQPVSEAVRCQCCCLYKNLVIPLQSLEDDFSRCESEHPRRGRRSNAD